MKKMILYFGIILFVVILVLILMVIVIFLQKNNYVKTNSIDSTFTEAKVLNENSYLGFLYLQSSDFSDRTLSKLNDDMPGSAVTSDEHVTGWFFCYPKDTDERLLTQMVITGGDYHVLGIKVGDSIDSATKILEQFGYQNTKSENNPVFKGTYEIYFQKYDIMIVLQRNIDQEIINKISILTEIK